MIRYCSQQFRGQLLASCPARHSVTLRCCLIHFAFLALTDFRRVQTHLAVEPSTKRLQYWLWQRQAKLPSQLAFCWIGVRVANLHAKGAAWEQVRCLYGGNRMAFAHHKFWHWLLLANKKPNEETCILPQELPGVSAIPRMHEPQKTTVSKGTRRKLLLPICFDN